MESGMRGVGPAPCPDCGSRASVSGGICAMCLADLGERHVLPVATIPPSTSGLRFTDVLAEIQEVVRLAGSAGNGDAVVAAGIRAERLLGSLRDQFLRDLGLPAVGSAGQLGC